MLENDIALLNKLFQSQNIFLKINLPDLFILLSSNFNICFLPFYSFNRKYVTAQESPTRPHMRGEIQPHHLTMPLDFNTNRPSLRMLNHGANILHRLEVTCIYWTKFHYQVLHTYALKQITVVQSETVFHGWRDKTYVLRNEKDMTTHDRHLSAVYNMKCHMTSIKDWNAISIIMNQD